MALTQGQAAAAKAFLKFLLDPKEKEFVLAGYSGCGKTYLTNYMIELAQSKQELMRYLLDSAGSLNFVLTALTNKAAQNMYDATGIPATTIHSYLKLRVYNDYRTGKTRLQRSKDFQVQSNVLLFIDEASMADRELVKLIRESTSQCKIVWIGDPKQILPVFSDEAPVFTQPQSGAELTEVVRQAEGNPIIDLATDLRKALDGGPMPAMVSRGDTIEHVDGQRFQQLVNKYMGDIRYTPGRYKILGWTNAKIHAYNAYVRSLHTPHEQYQVGETLIVNTAVITANTPLLQAETLVTVSDTEDGGVYGIKGQFLSFNDETTVFVANDYSEVNELLKYHKRRKDWHEFFAVKEAFADLRPSHASTVHKSQGSTYEAVFIDLDDIGCNNKNEEIIRLLYVAITRASHKVYLYGSLPDRLYR